MLLLLTVLGMVNTTFGAAEPEADTGSLVSMIDRTQAAQLYMGENLAVGGQSQ